jgi:hypothetical protein
LTAGTRRNGTSKFGSYRAASPGHPGLFDGGAIDGRDVVQLVGYPPYDDETGFGDDGFQGDPSSYGHVGPADYAGGASHETAGHETEPGKDARRYTGRHASLPGKSARKRIGKIVPAAAVVATLAAGTATAIGLSSGGQPQAGNLNASLALHDAVTSAPAAGAGRAHAAAAAPVGVTTAAASPAARTPKHAKTTPRSTPAATPAAATHAPAAASAPAAPARAAAPAKAAASAPAAAKPAAATTLGCNLSYAMLPDNVTAIVSFLVAHGYSDNAAAGIAGNIYQESKGNPESEGMGGGGLIGWTPLPSGFVTGNVAADLQTQLSALLTYNQGWSQYLPTLNSAASPSDAASIYVTDFERAGIPAASTREASAQNVASACGI